MSQSPCKKQNKDLKKALDYAISIIEAYEYDCKNLDEYLRDNDPKGFCQGKVYKNALTRIRGISGFDEKK